MASPPQWLRKRIFGISPEEVSFARRGFSTTNDDVRQRLENVGATFLTGYHAALDESHPTKLSITLDEVEAEFRGFAYEGAAMALALQDYLMRWKRDRFHDFVSGPGSDHAYMAHIGYGWVLARLRRPVRKLPRSLDPLLGWLALDGYGFHEGYFHWPRYVQRQEIPRRLSGYSRRAFDQGLGRSLWFVDGANVNRIPETISAFHRFRQSDLWSGIGLACAYAGGMSKESVKTLVDASGEFLPAMAQGAAFAAKARQRARIPSTHTDVACRVICNLSADDAADITDDALRGLDENDGEPAFEVWRRRIQDRLTVGVVRS